MPVQTGQPHGFRLVRLFSLLPLVLPNTDSTSPSLCCRCQTNSQRASGSYRLSEKDVSVSCNRPLQGPFQGPFVSGSGNKRDNNNNNNNKRRSCGLSTLPGCGNSRRSSNEASMEQPPTIVCSTATLDSTSLMGRRGIVITVIYWWTRFNQQSAVDLFTITFTS